MRDYRLIECLRRVEHRTKHVCDIELAYGKQNTVRTAMVFCEMEEKRENAHHKSGGPIALKTHIPIHIWIKWTQMVTKTCKEDLGSTGISQRNHPSGFVAHLADQYTQASNRTDRQQCEWQVF